MSKNKTDPQSIPEIEFQKVSKRYGDCISNQDISFSVKRGSIHALVGENGAGKSTLMKSLFGLIKPDSGEILVRGRSTRYRSSMDAMKDGIGMVHQHFMLADAESALDNIILGSEPGFRWFRIDRKLARSRLQELSDRNAFGFSKWDSPVRSLSVGEQQKLEILKLLYRNSQCLILDEPTAVLTPQEIDDFFKNLVQLKAQGKTILLISHKLREVMQFADRITVIRRGHCIADREAKDTNESELAELMVGRKIHLDDLGHRKVFANADRPAQVEVRGLTLLGGVEKVSNVSFSVAPGEIVGVAGIHGNGQSELFRYLIAPSVFSGEVRGNYLVDKKIVTRSVPEHLHACGIGVVQEDRQVEGLLMHESLSENLFLGQQKDPRYLKGFLVSRQKLATRMDDLNKRFDIRPHSHAVWASRLSGGNQQKLLLARALDHSPKILLIAQPTRGVDIGAIENIRKRILEERNNGCAILLVSTELDELTSLSDRILVFFNGEISATFQRKEFDEYAIGKAMGGGHA